RLQSQLKRLPGGLVLKFSTQFMIAGVLARIEEEGRPEEFIRDSSTHVLPQISRHLDAGSWNILVRIGVRHRSNRDRVVVVCLLKIEFDVSRWREERIALPIVRP